MRRMKKIVLLTARYTRKRNASEVSVTQPTWPVKVDLSDVLKDLPHLQLMDKEREKNQLEKREERKRLKEGNPKDMTIQLLREVLEVIHQPYSKSWKKIQLIQRVRDAREKENLTACHTTCNSA